MMRNIEANQIKEDGLVSKFISLNIFRSKNSNKFETNISLMIAAEGITRISSAYNIPIDQLTAGYDDLVKLGMLFYYY